jgi:hypothetical protein
VFQALFFFTRGLQQAAPTQMKTPNATLCRAGCESKMGTCAGSSQGHLPSSIWDALVFFHLDNG